MERALLQSGRVVSVLDMLKLHLAPLVVALDHLSRSQASASAAAATHGQGALDTPLPPLFRQNARLYLDGLRRVLEGLEFPATLAAVRRALERPADALTIRQLNGDIRDVHLRFFDEAEPKKCFILLADGAKYFEQEEPVFGKLVDAAFPSARFDLAEAGKCYALERDTAAVMHLVRGLEPALRAFSAHLHLQTAPNWNTALNQAEKLIRDREAQRSAGETEWLTKVATHFRFLKDALRNDAMHGGRRFGHGEAREMFEGIGPFMREVATRLEEPDTNELGEVDAARSGAA